MSLFVQIKTQALTDAKLLVAGPEAFAVWVRGLLYAKEHLTDGYVPSGALPLLTLGCADASATIRRLVDADLWEACEGGYTVGEERWARHQTTKDEVEAKREADRERQRTWREQQRAKQHSNDNGTGEAPATGQSISTSDDGARTTAAAGAGQPDGTSSESKPNTIAATAETDGLFAHTPATAAAEAGQPENGVTHLSQECHAVTGQPEHRARAQSSEPSKKQHTHTARETAAAHPPPVAATPPPGTMAALQGLARQIVHAYPTSRAVQMNPLEPPPHLVAEVEGAILLESREADCDPSISGEQLLVWTREFAEIVAEWPPGDEKYIPGLKKFFREYMYRNVGRFKRGEDRGRKGHGSDARPSAREQRAQGNRAQLAEAFRKRRGAGRDGGAEPADDGELREPGDGAWPGRTLDGPHGNHRRAA